MKFFCFIIVSVALLSGCSPFGSKSPVKPSHVKGGNFVVTVKKAKRKVRFPKARDIKTITIMKNTAAGKWEFPKNPEEVKAEILKRLKRLKRSEPVAVKVPKLKYKKIRCIMGTQDLLSCI